MNKLLIIDKKVSIIIPAYNCENTISKTIDSILAQSYENFEIVIINDGSTDGTVSVINSYRLKTSKIVLISTDNNGPGHARNIGINKATGFYLYFVDADDQIPQDNLEKYVQLYEESNADLVISSYKVNVISDGIIISSKLVQSDNETYDNHEEFMDNLYPLMNQQLLYVIWNKFYKAEIVKKNKLSFPPYKSCEDRLFNLQYFKYVTKCRLTDNIMYDYSFEGNKSLTNKYLPKKFETFEEFYLELIKLTPKNISGSSALFLKGTMSCIIPLHSKECPLNYTEKLQDIRKILVNKNVRKASELTLTDSLLRKIFKGLFQSNSKHLLFIATYLMHVISNVSPAFIEKLKANF